MTALMADSIRRRVCDHRAHAVAQRLRWFATGHGRQSRDDQPQDRLAEVVLAQGLPPAGRPGRPGPRMPSGRPGCPSAHRPVRGRPAPPERSLDPSAVGRPAGFPGCRLPCLSCAGHLLLTSTRQPGFPSSGSLKPPLVSGTCPTSAVRSLELALKRIGRAGSTTGAGGTVQPAQAKPGERPPPGWPGSSVGSAQVVKQPLPARAMPAPGPAPTPPPAFLGFTS
jgi:hypothetical protein